MLQYVLNTIQNAFVRKHPLDLRRLFVHCVVSPLRLAQDIVTRAVALLGLLSSLL